MELTQEKLDLLIQGAAEVAKQNKERGGYRADFQHVAIVVGAQLQHTVIPLSFPNSRQKAITMQALSEAARMEHALAIVLVNDVRWVNAAEFSKYFHIPAPADCRSTAEWEKHYLSILNPIYGGSLEHLPPQVVREAISITVKGPAIMSKNMLLYYTKGPGDTVEWQPNTDTPDKVEVRLLPDWWEEPTGQVQ